MDASSRVMPHGRAGRNPFGSRRLTNGSASNWRGSVPLAAGVIDQLHVRPWSTVMRVPTDRGDLYFKANTPLLQHEAALVTILAARRPDCVPPLLAVDLERGWMLMADAGTRLREFVERERDLSCWLEILPLYAGLQIDLADQVDEMVAAGVPDLRLSRLPLLYEQLLESLVELPVDDRRRLEAKRASRARTVQGAGRLWLAGDDSARRFPRRPGLRPRRSLPPARLGRCLRLPPVLHAVRHAGGPTRVGSGRCRGLGRRGAVPRRVPGSIRPDRRERRPRGRLRDRNAARLGLPRRQRAPDRRGSGRYATLRLHMFLDGRIPQDL